MSAGADASLLERAIELAARGERATAPNPRVGAVVVNNDRIVGEGWHQRAGSAHAEIQALEQASGSAPGGQLYVSLEPCCHRGRTPPCTEAIVRAGIRRVVVAMEDPDPRVSGRGLDELRSAGIEVAVFEPSPLSQRAARLIEDYVVHRREGRAFVVLKMATTLDAKIADRNRRSKWITGEPARAHGRRLRDRFGAILVGARTILEDDPQLLPPSGEQGGRFARCVLDGSLNVRPDARIFTENSWTENLVYCREDADADRRKVLEDTGARVVPIPGLGELLGLRAVLEDLAQRDLLGVVVEGGAQTASSFLGQRLVDRLQWYVAPKVIGDPGAVTALETGERALADAWGFRVADVEAVGEDVALTMYPRTEP